MSKIEILQRKAQELRITIINMIHKAGSGHSGGSLSSSEILTVLYEDVMNIRPNEPLWEDRDRFVLSKGHGAPALYAILAQKGFFNSDNLNTLRQLDSCLQGHPCMFKLPGIEMSTGSLGMGISVGVGMALAAQLHKRNNRVFVLCGDGELQEGQNWEAMISAAKWKLDNLVIIIDRNHVQLDGTEEQVMPMGDLNAKLKSFIPNLFTCDGHDVKALLDTFQRALNSKGPSVIVAETVKGKGVSFMEGQSAWHGKTISKEEYILAIKELEEGLK
ncbi:MAG TPA: transketolase [Ruminiclostridium sp.]